MQRKRSPEVRPVPSPETPVQPETMEQRAPDLSVEQGAEAPVQTEPVQEPVSVPQPTPEVPIVSEQVRQVEGILSAGLADIYVGLPDDVKPKFKAKGEEVARQVATWMEGASLVAKNVLRLVREWLGMIPRVNQYYLEQESKIKTDQIMSLAEGGEEL